MEKRKCKTCGNLFEPKGANDRYCSTLCRTAGCFIGGGGDTSKPNTVGLKPKPQKKQSKSVKKDFPRVDELMKIPIGERWQVAKDFTDEEKTYAKKLAVKFLREERLVDCISQWNCGEEEEEKFTIENADRVGDSDDGSI